MIVLAAFNSESTFFRGKTAFDSRITHTTHQFLLCRSPIVGLGFRPALIVKTPLKAEKSCRQCIIQDTHLMLEENGRDTFGISRRLTVLLGSSLLAAMVGSPEKALAVKQLQLAGRVPGISPPDENGIRTYHRPEAKSGGHGVGWSPMIPYSFKVPPEWEEVPVSIADLGGTEIDLRFTNQKEGKLSVVVAPVLRFADDDENARIEDIGPPEKVIYAFGPELIGDNIEGKVKSAEIKEQSGRKYYQYEIESPHALVTATAAGNRLYLMTVTGSGRSLYPMTFPSSDFLIFSVLTFTLMVFYCCIMEPWYWKDSRWKKPKLPNAECIHLQCSGHDCVLWGCTTL